MRNGRLFIFVPMIFALSMCFSCRDSSEESSVVSNESNSFISSIVITAESTGSISETLNSICISEGEQESTSEDIEESEDSVSSEETKESEESAASDSSGYISLPWI